MSVESYQSDGGLVPVNSARPAPLEQRCRTRLVSEETPEVRECQLLLGPGEAVYLPIPDMKSALEFEEGISVKGIAAFITALSPNPGLVGSPEAFGDGLSFDNLDEFKSKNMIFQRPLIAIGDGRHLPGAFEVGLHDADDSAMEGYLDVPLAHPATTLRGAYEATRRKRLSESSIVIGHADQLTSVNPDGQCLTYTHQPDGDYKIAAIIGRDDIMGVSVVQCPDASLPRSVIKSDKATLLGWLIIDNGGVLVADKSAGQPDLYQPGRNISTLLVNIHDREHLEPLTVAPEIGSNLVALPPARKRTFVPRNTVSVAVEQAVPAVRTHPEQNNVLAIAVPQAQETANWDSTTAGIDTGSPDSYSGIIVGDD